MALVAALCRLSDSAFALSMVQGSPSLPTLAAAPAKAVLAVEGTLPDGETATSPCPSRAAAGRCPTVAADRSPGQGDVSPGLRCGP